MNITLSADEKLIKKSREYAERHHTTLNNLIREYLQKISVGNGDGELSISEEFARTATLYAGESEPGYHFNREELHKRGRSDG